jgi:hypothetical protein
MIQLSSEMELEVDLLELYPILTSFSGTGDPDGVVVCSNRKFFIPEQMEAQELRFM